jgi:translation elongation factor EF-Tu-like GTPase
MRVGDVIDVRGRGTVITGKLEGVGNLQIGDRIHCDGMTWTVGGLDQSSKILQAAYPGTDIGVLLGNGPPGEVLRGRIVGFEAVHVDARRRGQLGPSWSPTAKPNKKLWRR